MSQSEAKVKEVISAAFQGGKEGEFLIFVSGGTEMHLRRPRDPPPLLDVKIDRLQPGNRVAIECTYNESKDVECPVEGVLYQVRGEVALEMKLFRLGDYPDRDWSQGAMFCWNEEEYFFFSFTQYPWLADRFQQHDLGQLMYVELINVNPNDLTRATLLEVSKIDSTTPTDGSALPP